MMEISGIESSRIENQHLKDLHTPASSAIHLLSLSAGVRTHHQHSSSLSEGLSPAFICHTALSIGQSNTHHLF
jgi:hypothetical protein